MSNSNSTPVIILGMHRSGTSMLSGILNILGVHLGDSSDLMEAQKDVNAKGFWEREDIVSIHEEVFAHLGTDWQGLSSLPKEWQHDTRLVDCRERLTDIFMREFIQHDIWGIKDPRMCRLLPMWLLIFEKLNLAPKFILITRHPMEVAQSLAKRNRFSTKYSLLLWLKHIFDADLNSTGFVRCWVSYEELNTSWSESVLRIASELNLEWPNDPASDSVQRKMNDFISKELWHNHANTRFPDKPEELKTVPLVYDALLLLASAPEKTPELLKKLDDLRNQCRPLFDLIDETTHSTMLNSASLYGYVKKFQEENKFLNKRVKTDAGKLDSLHRENRSLLSGIADLELKNKKLKTLGMYSFIKKIQGMWLK